MPSLHATLMAMNCDPQHGNFADEFSQWTTDILGEPYQAAVLELGNDPDHETDIAATLVRVDPTSDLAQSAENSDFNSPKPALLWIHGMSDYFFQRHVGEKFAADGYGFYAIDLRKCGRSLRPGQRAHHITNLDYYFEELSAAVDKIANDGYQTIVPVAHSTGGLIAALWLNYLRRHDQQRFSHIAGLALNSPWLDLQLPQPKRTAARIIAPLATKFRPDVLTPDDGLGGYGESIHKDHHGAWDFDVKLKPIAGHEKVWSWLNAILQGQKQIRKGIDTGVPTLVMHSSGSLLDQPYRAELDTVDAVLDTDQIARRTKNLGSKAFNVVIPQALHDVFLSEDYPRRQAFEVTEEFLHSLR